MSFQVARGRLKGNFIVHNTASTSDFRRRQIVLAFSRKRSTVKNLMKQTILIPSVLLPLNSPFNLMKYLKTIDFHCELSLARIGFNSSLGEFAPHMEKFDSPPPASASRAAITLSHFMMVNVCAEAGLTFYRADTDCCYDRNMQKLWCVQHKNIKGLHEGLHMGCIIKKNICDMMMVRWSNSKR
jgi:hypothetical protein